MSNADKGNNPNRPKRTPFSQTRRLAFQERPGYKRRIFNDVDDRIQRAEAAGYKAVSEKDFRLPTDGRAGTDTQVGSVLKRSVGNGTMGVLMEIPEEFYNEDQERKVRDTEEVERALKRDAKKSGLRGTLTIGRKDHEDDSE